MKVCKGCGKEKEESYKTRSYCSSCSVEKTKEWRLSHPGHSKKAWEVSKKRKIKNEFCSVCQNEKEPKWRHTSYCGKCASKKARVWELNNKSRVRLSIEKRRIIRQTTKCAECKCNFIRKRGENVCCLRCKLLNEKKVNETGCWISPLLGGRGYGQISFRGTKNKASHRLSYELFVGAIPKGMHVCHKCDVPSCYNPDHLFIGTPGDNVRDGIAKGRIKHIGAKGRNCKFTNLTEEQIKQMRMMFNEGFSFERLSIIFKCSRSYVSKIIRGLARR